MSPPTFQQNDCPKLKSSFPSDEKARDLDASRELVEAFISHLATSAQENRDGLLCKLNSYAQPVEAKL